MLHAKIINKNFVNKSDISGFINSTDLNEKRKTKKISSKCIVKSRAIQNRKNTNDKWLKPNFYPMLLYQW